MQVEVFNGPKVPNELKTIEVDVEKRIFNVNGEPFGQDCTYFSISCDAVEGYIVRMEIGTEVQMSANYSMKEGKMFSSPICELKDTKKSSESDEHQSGEAKKNAKRNIQTAADIDAAIKSVAAKITKDDFSPNEYADTVKALAELVRARSLLD